MGHQPVTAVTDHASLDTFLTTGDLHDSQGRLCRWWSELSRYSLTIPYIKGEQNVVADYLSRPPLRPTLSVAALTRQQTKTTHSSPDKSTTSDTATHTPPLAAQQTDVSAPAAVRVAPGTIPTLLSPAALDAVRADYKKANFWSTSSLA